MTFEDIAMIRTIPRSIIFDISDGTMLGKTMKLTKDMDGVIYIRTPRRGLPDVYSPDEVFELGIGKKLNEGNDCTVVASGIMLSSAIEAAQALDKEGITIDLIDPVTIKPLDEELIITSAKNTGKVVTIENHSVYGGLGGAVSELLSEQYPVKVKRIGTIDFGQVGNEAFLREQYHLDVKNIVDTIREFCGGDK